MNSNPFAPLIHAVVPFLLFSVSAATAQQVSNWGAMAINASAAGQITRGEGVKVGILDTGIQKNHPDLQGNIIGGVNLVKKAGGSTRWDDDHGHGTHIAGVIAALDNTIGYVGVAPSAKLFVVKVLPTESVVNPSLIDSKVVADGIYACMANGFHVMNMSFGIAADAPVLRSAITAAANAGIVLVIDAWLTVTAPRNGTVHGDFPAHAAGGAAKVVKDFSPPLASACPARGLKSGTTLWRQPVMA